MFPFIFLLIIKIVLSYVNVFAKVEEIVYTENYLDERTIKLTKEI